MRELLKVGLAGTGLAMVTAGLGLFGLRDWSPGESGGHWIAIVGITFLLPLLLTGSWVLAGSFHWAVCTAAVGTAWRGVRLARRVFRGSPSEPRAATPPESPRDSWVPPSAEEIARVVRGRRVPPPDPHDV